MKTLSLLCSLVVIFSTYLESETLPIPVHRRILQAFLGVHAGVIISAFVCLLSTNLGGGILRLFFQIFVSTSLLVCLNFWSFGSDRNWKAAVGVGFVVLLFAHSFST